MRNDRVGIPTEYRGIQMRSRCEARAAAFFDLLGWVWEYEPFDLNGYIPDFAVHMRDTVVVEIKSVTEDRETAKRKLEISGWEREAIIISRQPGLLCDGAVVCGQRVAPPPEYVIGDLMQVRERDDAPPVWDLATLHFCISCGAVSYHAECGDWRCRSCGTGNGRDHIGLFDPRKAWAEASNRVQWRKPA